MGVNAESPHKIFPQKSINREMEVSRNHTLHTGN